MGCGRRLRGLLVVSVVVEGMVCVWCVVCVGCCVPCVLRGGRVTGPTLCDVGIEGALSAVGLPNDGAPYRWVLPWVS